MLNGSLCLHAKLDIVAICPSHNPYSFDLLEGECGKRLLFVAHQTKTPDATAIGEADVFAIGFNLPARLFVFDGTVIMLKPGIAFLAGLLLLAQGAVR